MDKETQNTQSVETEISSDSVSDADNKRPKEFIEPLKEIDGSPEGKEKINLNPDMNDKKEIETEGQDQEPPDDAFPETDGLAGQDSVEAPSGDKADQPVEDAEETLQAEASTEATSEVAAEEFEAAAQEPEDASEQPEKDSEEVLTENQDAAAAELESSDFDLDRDDDNARETSEPAPDSETEFFESEEISNDKMELEEDESPDVIDEKAGEEPTDENYAAEREPITAGSETAARKKKSGNLTKLAFSAIIICSLIIVLLAYTNQFSFLKNDTTRQTVVPAPVPDPAEPPRRMNETPKNDPYAQYRSKLREAAALRESILMKQQEIQRLKIHYAEGIEKLENDILVEILDYNLINYEQALEYKRVELGLQSIQRRQAYIQKLDDPMKWLELGGEELLYLKRKAAFDLQLIEIAGSIDMNMHMRHINAAIQKYRLTADNLAIDPEEAEMESLRKIWQRLSLKTKKNPFLRADLNNWYIQQEICSGNLSRIGELSKITTETARCMSEIETADLFLNNITELSPSVTKYLCRWDGKWLCLNGVNAISPSVAEYLFQWKGEWISLNGLSEFPPDRAKHLVQWQGKQLELMGLQDNIKKTDRQTLTYLVEWEKAGGRLYVPQHIRNMMDQL